MAGRHKKYHKDPFRETYPSYSEQGRENFDKIDWSDGVKAEPEPEPKIPFMAPGPVFMMELGDIPRGMTFSQAVAAAIAGDAPDFVRVIEQKPEA